MEAAITKQASKSVGLEAGDFGQPKATGLGSRIGSEDVVRKKVVDN